MLDVLYAALGVAFFVIAVAYVLACEKMRGRLPMSDYIWISVLCLLLLIYLLYALIKPEKF